MFGEVPTRPTFSPTTNFPSGETEGNLLAVLYTERLEVQGFDIPVGVKTTYQVASLAIHACLDLFL